LIFDGDIFHLLLDISLGRESAEVGKGDTIIINKFDVHSESSSSTSSSSGFTQNERTTKKGVLCLHRDRAIEQRAQDAGKRRKINLYFILQVKFFFLLFESQSEPTGADTGCLLPG